MPDFGGGGSTHSEVYKTDGLRNRGLKMSGEKIDVSDLALQFRAEVQETIRSKFGGRGPKLVGFLANEDPAARKYAFWTKKACEKDGITFEIRQVGRTELEDALEIANRDPEVHGILIYYPAFGNHPSFYGGTMDDYLRDSVSITKDVEGLCYTYRYNLYHNIRYLEDKATASHLPKCVVPCTALSIVKILEYLNVYDHTLPEKKRLSNRSVTIFNRSEIVGRPLAAMLANDGADVYSVDIDSLFLLRSGKLLETEETPESACRKSSVVITGVPNKSFKINSDWIQPNTVIVNFSAFENISEQEVLEIPGVKFVPLIGKVTVAMLERNALRLFDNFHRTCK